MSAIEERFWAKVEKSDGCWLWRGSSQRYGYGTFFVLPRRRLAHRIAWELSRGPVPNGLCVLHRCDNPPCVNPDHLFLGTKGDNNRDRAAKGRSAKPGTVDPETRPRGDRHWSRLRPELRPRGERQGSAKLTAELVLAMRALHRGGAGTPTLARQFGVSQATAYNAVTGKTWRHVKENSDGIRS